MLCCLWGRGVLRVRCALCVGCWTLVVRVCCRCGRGVLCVRFSGCVRTWGEGALVEVLDVEGASGLCARGHDVRGRAGVWIVDRFLSVCGVQGSWWR